MYQPGDLTITPPWQLRWAGGRGSVSPTCIIEGRQTGQQEERKSKSLPLGTSYQLREKCSGGCQHSWHKLCLGVSVNLCFFSLIPHGQGEEFRDCAESEETTHVSNCHSGIVKTHGESDRAQQQCHGVDQTPTVDLHLEKQTHMP